VERYSAPDPERAPLDRRLAEIRMAFPKPGEFSGALARTAMSEERLRSFVADNLRIESYLVQRFDAAAQPTPDEVQRYHRDHPEEFTSAGRVAALEDVQTAVVQKALAARRAALIKDWLDRLRLRAGLTAPQVPKSPVSELR